jgi:aldehyde dehydrogenase (NAD+)
MSLTAKIETPSISYEQPIGLYIDGKWVKGVEGKTFETINPTDEKVIIAVHEAGPEGETEDLQRQSRTISILTHF